MSRLLVINTVKTDPNGIAQVIFNINDHIDHSNLIVDLFSINDPEQIYHDKIEKYGGKIIVKERSLTKLIPYLIKLIKTIRNGKYDVVHAHGNSATLLFEMFAAYIAGCKVRIAHSHNTTCDNIKLHNLLWPLFDKLVTDRFACGIAAGKWLFRDNDFVVINNGIDTCRFKYNAKNRTAIRSRLGVADDTSLVGNVGFFNDQKNQIQLLDIFDSLLKIRPNSILVLIGDGPNKSQIYDKIEKLSIGKNVILTGLINDVPDYLSALDVIVMPSLYEGLPLSLIEEQANGLTCVVSDKITTEVNKTGNVVFLPLTSPASSWADVIDSILKSPKDRSIISQNAIMTIEDSGYSIVAEARKVFEYYNIKIRN